MLGSLFVVLSITAKKAWCRDLIQLWWELETADLLVLADRNELVICGCWSSPLLSPMFQYADFHGSLCSQHKNKLDSQGKLGYCWQHYRKDFSWHLLDCTTWAQYFRGSPVSAECVRGLTHPESLHFGVNIFSCSKCKVTKSQPSAEHCSSDKREKLEPARKLELVK